MSHNLFRPVRLFAVTLAAAATALSGGTANADIALPELPRIAAPQLPQAFPGLLGMAATAAAPAVAPSPVKADSRIVNLEVMPGVRYSANTTDMSAKLTAALGTVTTAGGQVQIQDGSGKVVFGGISGAPLALQSDAADTSSLLMRAALGIPGLAHDTYSSADYNAALSTAATQFGLATGVGAMVGGVAGLVLGCPIGAAILIPIDILSTPIGGCLAGAATFAGLGAVVGGAALGIPVGIYSWVQMNQTLAQNTADEAAES